MTSTNWAGNLRYSATSLLRPGTVEELQEVVAREGYVRALGSRHSFNTIADTDFTQVSLAEIPLDLVIDTDARTATVGAGARYGAFVEELAAAGWAIHNLASLPHISVGGAIATSTHGSGDRNGSLAAAVAAIDLVTADGSLRRLSRGDADFDGAVVSLGALGVVARVALDLEPTFDVRQDVFENVPWEALRDNYDAITSSAYSVSLFTNWDDDGITQAWLKSRSGGTDAAEFFGGRRATAQRHPLPGISGDSTTEQLGITGPWWNRLAHFKLEFTPSNGAEIQTEYLVPRRHAVAAIEAVRELAPRFRDLLYISELRSIAADDLWLSPAYHEDCVGFHFTWKRMPEVDALLPHLDATFAPFAGRPHWGKVFDADPARIAGLYPRLADFRELADRLDPAGKFRNAFIERWLFTA